MSGINAAAVRAAERLPPEPNDTPKRDGGKEPRPRRVAKPKTNEAEVTEPQVRKLNVSV